MNTPEVQVEPDWVTGFYTGLDIPTHSQALLEKGTEYLTEALRHNGILDADNAVVEITRCVAISAGSTGSKLRLTVIYKQPDAPLHRQLFIKFSRDFSSAKRDAGRYQMEREVQFALLSREPGFPIKTPECYFADFDRETGSGILITQCIHYGYIGIEKHYPKALDYRMPEPLSHYKALIQSLARLAAAHQSGKLANTVEQYFPFTLDQLDVSTRKPATPEQIREKVIAYGEFAHAYPQLLPHNIRSDDFLQRLLQQAPRFQALQGNINGILQNKPELIALSHWNAHVDNAWFWRNESNEIDCGLLDWGNASQMNLAMAIWGCLSAAELNIWDDHLDELLTLFIQEVKLCGGAEIHIEDLKLHLTVYMGMMGLTWLLDSPLYTLIRLPDLAEVEDRTDARIAGNERARAQLQIMTVFLNYWETVDMEDVLHQMKL